MIKDRRNRHITHCVGTAYMHKTRGITCYVVAHARLSPDGGTMFVNIQHPGEATTAWGTPTTADPDAVSGWPHDGAGRPRPSTVVIRRLDGGKIGS